VPVLEESCQFLWTAATAPQLIMVFVKHHCVLPYLVDRAATRCRFRCERLHQTDVQFKMSNQLRRKTVCSA
jgi:hypothetical protein